MSDKVAPYGLSELITGPKKQAATPDLSAIKSNVQRMIEQDAPEADIDEYLSLEGVTPEQLQGAGDPRNNAMGKLDAVVRGAADMLSFGGADEFAATMDAFTQPVFGRGSDGANFSERYDKNLAEQRGIDQSDYENRFGYRLGGQVAGGVTGGAGVARQGLSFGANAIKGGQGLGKITAGSAADGLIMGGLHGFGSGEGGLDRAKQAALGGALGLGLGAATPLVLGAGGWMLRKAISPFKTSPERVAMADALTRESVELTAGQKTGSNALRYAESEIGGQKAADMMERQGEQYTSAALKRAGITADRATPDVIDDGFTRIGKQFDDLAARNQMQPDQKMLTDLRDVVTSYFSLVPESQRAPIIKQVVGDILKTSSLNAPNGSNALKGASYQSLRSTLERAAKGAGDPKLADALRGIKDTLDDTMERSIAKNNPADAGAWQEARRQYRNMLVLEKSATGAGENTALGFISPSHLRSATVQQGRRGYARGRGDFAELARAGEALLKPLPNSGTPGRTAVRALGTSIPALLGAGAGSSVGGPLGAMAGMAAGAMLPKIAGVLMMSKPGQAYLGNQAAKQLPPGIRAIVNAILVNEGSAATGRLPAP